MSQAQIDLQIQLEQASSDLTTHPLFNDFPILFLETMEQTQTNTNSTTDTEQTEQEHNSSKKLSPPDDNTTETPPPPKNAIKL